MSASRRRGWLVPLLLVAVVFVAFQWWTGRTQRAIGDELAAAARTPEDLQRLRHLNERIAVLKAGLAPAGPAKPG